MNAKTTAVLLGATLLAVAGVATASDERTLDVEATSRAGTGTITACIQPNTKSMFKSGIVRANGYSTGCPRTWNALTWNKRGPQGPRGKQGPAGEDGSDGAQGPTGAEGPQGPVGPQGLQGPQGPQGDQGPTGDQGPDAFLYLYFDGTSATAFHNLIDFSGTNGEYCAVPASGEIQDHKVALVSGSHDVDQPVITTVSTGTCSDGQLRKGYEIFLFDLSGQPADPVEFSLWVQ